VVNQLLQGDHLSGNPGNVREFDEIDHKSGKCQGNNLVFQN